VVSAWAAAPGRAAGCSTTAASTATHAAGAGKANRRDAVEWMSFEQVVFVDCTFEGCDRPRAWGSHQERQQDAAHLLGYLVVGCDLRNTSILFRRVAGCTFERRQWHEALDAVDHIDNVFVGGVGSLTIRGRRVPPDGVIKTRSRRMRVSARRMTGPYTGRSRARRRTHPAGEATATHRVQDQYQPLGRHGRDGPAGSRRWGCHGGRPTASRRQPRRRPRGQESAGGRRPARAPCAP